MYSESHCHLGDMGPGDVKRAEDAGLALMITMGLDEASTAVALKLAQRHKCVRLSLAVHPWYSDEYTAKTRKMFVDLAKNPEVVAIGETGLDFTGRMSHQWVREEKYVDKAIQRATFRAHVQLARELKLPVIVHDRGEWQEALDILEELGAPKTGAIIHGFAKDEAYAKRCEALGIHLSLGLRTLQAPPPGFEAAVKRTPMRLIVTETDSNKPWEVIKACEIIGKIKGVTTDEVGSKATENLRRLTSQ
ncbi:MAG: TatD family hydrolase [Candidatus Bathyarchaeota archaeon]|nr:TatD family hydrolase [Candidatus Bathyarchaeota archaeon]